jgi:hypothetical protein
VQRPRRCPEKRHEYEPDDTDQTDVWLSNSSTVATSSGERPELVGDDLRDRVSCPCPCGAVPS